MKALQYLNKYFWKYKWRILLGTVFVVCSNVFTVYAPQVIREAVNFLNDTYSGFQENPDAEQTLDLPQSLQWFMDPQVANADNLGSLLLRVALALGLLYIVLYFVKGVFSFLTRQTIIVMSRLIEYDLKNEVYDHYQRLSMAFYKRNNTGDLMNRISEDVSRVRMYLGPAVMYTINLFVLLVMVVTVMLYIDAELTLWSLAPLPFMSISIYLVSSTINKKSEAVQKQQSHLSTMVQESISGVRVLKAYNRETAQRETFADESDLYKVKLLDLVKVEALFMPIIVLLVGLSTILTIYIGGTKVVAGELEIGQIFQFVFYVNLLTWPFASVGWVTSLVQKAEASQKRINEFLLTDPEVVNTNDAPLQVQGGIAFDNVSFTYPDSGIEALKNVSFEIKPGETLAVIGRTGSGKSTLANLVARQYDVTAGEIRVDEAPIQGVNLYDLRAAMGYVPQDVFLFSDSIYNNIKFGVDEADEARLVQAAKDADIHENILGFAEGYQTLLGERGINLSGGQKQRISIARAIIKNPDILIFDDCLSAVDTETEEKILSALKRIMEGKTSIIIAHRVSTIKHADRILVLDEGRVIEQGTHQQLVDSEGTYADLYRQQLAEDRA
ncbi:MAG: ABC transporter ATP-binding protein [Flavobacteriales bacterium]